MPEYAVWNCMRQRCFIKTHRAYARYGGRGITVCERWRTSFANFIADMGPRPSPEYSIDRYPDNNGNYEPGNCRWATRKEQQANMRSNWFITIDGETKILREWARTSGVCWVTIKRRLKKGWMPKEAVFTPVHI